MTHAPKFWAEKLPESLRAYFWTLVTEWHFSGETAYFRVLEYPLTPYGRKGKNMKEKDLPLVNVALLENGEY